jgi:hypothetical protein
MTAQGPKYGWQNLHDPDQEYDIPLTGLSGTIVQNPHRSPEDLPFLHPFDNDFEFHIAPDPPYMNLVAPKMTDDNYVDSTNNANALGLQVRGVIGLELDNSLVPSAYKPKLNDRTAVWGRWIVDAGHDDFHTEIHPPLIMVGARPSGGGTKVSVYTRPYLVSQDFGDGGLLEHLVIEVAKVDAQIFGIPVPLSTLIRAHPRLMPKPFAGLNIVSFKVRPPPRTDPRDSLQVRMSFTRRDDSVAIQVVRGSDGESIRVVMVLNEAGYVPPPEPPRTNRRYTLDEISEMSGDAADAITGGVLASILAGPLAFLITQRGVETHRYGALKAPVLPAETVMPLASLHPVDIKIDSTQPFPLMGNLTLEWKRFLSAGSGQAGNLPR